jgi:ABC-type multidrug transport system ATPase subunit
MVLEVEGMTVMRGGRRVIDDVSFTAREGEVLAILGPNGAGKTTILEALVGLVPATTRALRFGGERIETFRDRAGIFGYMPDEARLPEEVSVGTALGVRRLEGVDDFLGRRGGTLSRGEEKRVWLAWTLSMGRAAAVLDEPFGAFDPVALDGILDLVRERARKGVAVVASIHQMAIAERIADRVVILHEGRVVAQGTREELGPLEEAFRAHIAGA